MISYLSRSITLFLLRNNVVDAEKRSVYEYGFEVIISTVIGFVLIFISGFILDELLSSMIFYAMFIIVRQYTGGYHANSHLKCKSTMLCLCLLVLLSAKYLTDLFSFVWHLTFLIIYFVTVVLCAPVEHINAPLTDELKIRNKKISVIIAIILTAVNLFGYRFSRKYSMVSSFTLFIIAILIIIPKFLRKESQFYEKDNRKNT